MSGFITKTELNEARMLSNLKELTDWQKKRLMKLYLKQHTGQTVKLTEVPENKHIAVTKNWFNNESKI